MSDDIETLRQALGVLGLDWPIRANNAIDALERLEKANATIRDDLKHIEGLAEGYFADYNKMTVERNSLRKALDDRFAADKRAAKAIFTATGRKWGFPDNVEVVAWYVAEVERLEARVEYLEGCKGWANIAADRASLRAKLDRAREALGPFADLRFGRFMTDGCRYDYRLDVAWVRRARTALAELSADARETTMQALTDEAQAIGIYPDAPAQQTQISDEA